MTNCFMKTKYRVCFKTDSHFKIKYNFSSNPKI